MKLTKFRVQNYRSIIDTNFVDVEDIMVLVGPNQAGKSSVLKGLYSIAFDYIYDIQNELTQLENINKKYVDKDLKATDLPIITGIFSLDDNDKNELKESIGEMEGNEQEGNEDQSDEDGKHDSDDEQTNLQTIDKSIVGSINEIQITKFIDGSYHIKIGDNTLSYPLVFEQVSQINKILENMKTKYDEDFKSDPNSPFKPQYDEMVGDCIDLIPEDGYKIMNKEEMPERIRKFCENVIAEPLSKKIKQDARNIEKILENYPDFSLLRILSFFIDNMPRPVYFKDYDRIGDSLTLAEIESNPKPHQPFLNLLQLAEVKLSSIKDQLDNETGIQQYLENASGIASKKIRDVWKQESFDLKIRYSNKRLMVFTADPAEPGTLLPPSYGSEGFQWFLGFFINFAVATKTEYKNAILLLDDPGVLLHPTGHKDLLRRFREYLKDEVRTIYSTHIPSLIPKDSINSIRVVYKENGKTNVEKKFWKLGNKDIWEPIRTSLGIDLTDSLFLGNQTVMVEGPSDQIYIQQFIKLIQKTNKNISNRFVLAIGGISKTEYFITFFGSQGLAYVALLDSTNKFEGNTRIIKINPKNKFREEQQDFDIEDMIGNELLAEAFSNIFTDINSSDVLSKLKSGNAKAVNILKEILQSKGKNKNDLDKVSLANQVTKIANNNPEKYQQTIENFLDILTTIESKFNH